MWSEDRIGRGQSNLSCYFGINIAADYSIVSCSSGPVDSERVCGYCRTFNWDMYSNWRNVPPSSMTGPSHPVQDFFFAYCRICHLLARCVTHFGLGNMFFGDKIRFGVDSCGIHPYSWTIDVSRLPVKVTGNDVQPIEELVSLSKISSYLKACKSHHTGGCILKSERVVSNLRVIDCVAFEVIEAPVECEYVALSYVWGNSFSEHGLSSMLDLPRTIKQSISVVLGLGFRYLWVDRYVSTSVLIFIVAKYPQCIDQTNEQHRENQILQMSSIYRAAQLTIVAAAGDDPDYGLPGVDPYPRLLKIQEVLGSLCLIAEHPDAHNHHEHYHLDIMLISAWASRAWTYQEAIFSWRRLIFTEYQAIFSCNTNTCFEWGEIIDNADIQLLEWCNYKRDRKEPLDVACRTMHQYSSRKLSRGYDALNAIMSTMDLVLQHDEYHIWGVPFRLVRPAAAQKEPETSCNSNPETHCHGEQIEIKLVWFHNLFATRRPGFPSWSPLGWSGRIDWITNSAYEGFVSIVKPSGSECLSANLSCAKMSPSRMPQKIQLVLKTAPVGRHVHGEWDNVAVVLGYGFEVRYSGHLDRRVEVGTPLKFAVISEHEWGPSCLILLKQTDCYERVGRCTIRKDTSVSYGIDGEIWGYNKMTPDRLRHMELSTGPKVSNVDQKKLIECFKGLIKYDWWDDLFTEEHIILE